MEDIGSRIGRRTDPFARLISGQQAMRPQRIFEIFLFPISSTIKFVAGEPRRTPQEALDEDGWPRNELDLLARADCPNPHLRDFEPERAQPAPRRG
jgi:hypothetical protein